MAQKIESYSCSSDCLNIEIGCPLFIQFPNYPDRLKTQLIGLSAGAYIIVSDPVTGNSVPAPAGTSQVVLRYIFRGEVLGFKSSIIGQIEKPFRLMFLSYPTAIERLNLRKETRIGCNLPCSLIFGDFSARGLIADLSTGGCRVTARLPAGQKTSKPELDAPIGISLALPGSGGTLELKGKVRSESLSNDRAELGIKFSEMDEQAKAKLEAYVIEVSQVI